MIKNHRFFNHIVGKLMQFVSNRPPLIAPPHPIATMYILGKKSSPFASRSCFSFSK
jgi:hypothetical protein